MAHMFLQVPGFMLSQMKSLSEVLSTTPLQPVFLEGESASAEAENRGALGPPAFEYQNGAPKSAPLEKGKDSSTTRRDHRSPLANRSDPSSSSPSESLQRAESLTSAGEMLKLQPVAASVASKASNSSKWFLQTESQEKGPFSFEAALVGVLANLRGQVVLRNLVTKRVLQKEFVLKEFNNFAEELETKLQEQEPEGPRGRGVELLSCRGVELLRGHRAEALRDIKGPTASTLPEGDSIIISRSNSPLHSKRALDSMASALRSRKAPLNTLEELFFMCEGSFGFLSRIKEGNRQVLNQRSTGNRST